MSCTARNPEPPIVNADFFRDLERERTGALVAQDMERAERLHAPDYHLVTPAGKSFERAAYLAAVATGELRYVRWEHEHIEVRLSSDMAIVRYKASLHFLSGKVVVCWHTDSYEQREGHWQAVWSQATSIPQSTPGRVRDGAG
jgi:hypothetical protein